MRWQRIFTCTIIGIFISLDLHGQLRTNNDGSSVATSKIRPDDTPYAYREFSFGYENVTDETVWVDSVKVLNRQVNLHRVWANGVGGGVTYSRNDGTPEALLKTRADFEWWHMADPFDSKSARQKPDDPASVFRSSTLFPLFDEEADGWRCLYTLQNDRTWVGRFEGVFLKPIGAKSETLQKSKLEGHNQWIQFQFRNLTDEEIYLRRGEQNLIHKTYGVELHLTNIPADDQFHGISAQSHEGSIYRPLPGDKLVLTWGTPASKLQPDDPIISHTQKIALPEFDSEVDDWFCYFTLNKNNEWTASFEGTAGESP